MDCFKTKALPEHEDIGGEMGDVFMEVAREEMEVAGAKIQRCVSGAL